MYIAAILHRVYTKCVFGEGTRSRERWSQLLVSLVYLFIAVVYLYLYILVFVYLCICVFVYLYISICVFVCIAQGIAREVVAASCLSIPLNVAPQARYKLPLNVNL